MPDIDLNLMMMPAESWQLYRSTERPERPEDAPEQPVTPAAPGIITLASFYEGAARVQAFMLEEEPDA